MSRSAARELDLQGYRDSAAHRLDPRAKLVATAVFLVCVVSFPKREVLGLVPYLALPLAMGALGRVGFRPVARLVLAASPFAVLAAAANPFLDRQPAAVILGVAVSGGVLSFASVVLRYVLCSSALLVVVAVTTVPGIVRALGRLGLPRPLGAQLMMLHRYLFLLEDEGERLSRARALREPLRKRATLGTARRMLSSLLWRSFERGDRVYQCMKVRGFDGSFPALSPGAFRTSDAVFLVGVSTACVALRTLALRVAS